MVLSLVLSNLKEISSPEPSIVDPRPVLTPLALASFPSEEYEQARGRLGIKMPKSSQRVPSLVELLLHQARLHSDRLEGEPENDPKLSQTKFPSLLNIFTPFYYHHSGDPVDFQRSSRRASHNSAPRRLYLTSATLIVVPPMLMEQWYREIQKHIETPVRVLRVGKNDILPTPSRLATDYDVSGFQILCGRLALIAHARLFSSPIFV